MRQNDNQELPVDTINLFSWDLLKQHYRTKPIVQKYFGEIGAEMFQNTSRTFADKSDHNPIADNFIREINQIDPRLLLDDYLPLNASDSPEQLFNDAKKYLFDRPYHFLFTDSEQLDVATLLLLLSNNLLPWMSITGGLESPSPQYRQDAMRYIHYCNLRSFNLSDDQIQRAKTTLIIYRAKYIFAKLGQRKTKKLLEQFFNFERLAKHVGKFYDFIDVAIGELHSENLFLHQNQPRRVDVDELANFDYIFEYPEWIEFTDTAHREIIDRILKDELTNHQIQYYLQTYIEPYNYTNLYPALKHILKTTDDFVTFYYAGDFLNQIWKNIPEGELNDWFKHEVYDIYWSRINGIWPFQNPEKIKARTIECYYWGVRVDDFLNGRADTLLQTGNIMDDAMNWITCLKKTNPELEKYFKELAKQDFSEICQHFPDGVGKRVFAIKYEKLGPKDKVEAVFREYGYEKDIAWRYLAYPDNIEEAKVALEKIFEDSILFNRLFALEQLVLTGNLDGVGAYVLNYLVDNFQQLSEDLQNHPDYIISIFTAACSGATEYSEIKPLEKFADKCRKLNFQDEEQRDYRHREINGALRFAKNIIEKFNRQRDDLAKNLRKHTAEIEAKAITK